MSSPTCESCRWWTKADAFKTYEDMRASRFYGQCRRKAPERQSLNHEDVFPSVYMTEWCGEHESRAEVAIAQRLQVPIPYEEMTQRHATRLRNVLTRRNIVDLYELLKLGRLGLFSLPNIGETTLYEVDQMFDRRDESVRWRQS